jgi:hypothetical protein
LSGVTERGISETVPGVPSKRRTALGALALVGILVTGGAVFGWLKLRPAPAAPSSCAQDEIRAPDGTCACPAGSTKSGDQCVAPPPAPCPAGQARQSERGACLCTDGKPPDATGACTTCSPSADQSAIRAALKDAETRAQQGCKAPGPRKNTGTVTITIAPTGHVVEATIEGGLAGTEGARCLQKFFQDASVACFSGEPVKLKKSIALE